MRQIEATLQRICPPHTPAILCGGHCHNRLFIDAQEALARRQSSLFILSNVRSQKAAEMSASQSAALRVKMFDMDINA